MPKKKGKGRGRGRGRGQSDEAQKEVGHKAALQQDASGVNHHEHSRPGVKPGTLMTEQTTGLSPSETSKPVPTPGQFAGAANDKGQLKPLNDGMSAMSLSTSKHEHTKCQVVQKDLMPSEERAKPVQAKSIAPQRQIAQPPREDIKPPREQAQPPKEDIQQPRERAHPSKAQGKAREDASKYKNNKVTHKEVVASSTTDERSRHRQEVALLPRRPDYGTLGRPINLKANFFRLEFHDVDYIFHYDIDIKPEKTPIPECRQIVKSAIDKYLDIFEGYKPAFDGRKNLYSRNRIPKVDGDKGRQLEVILPGIDGGKDRKFQLTIKYAAQVCVTDLQKFLSGQFYGKMPQEAVQALDIVLRQIPSLYFTPIGRSFFPPPDGRADVGSGCEIWTGFYQSIRPSQWKTMLVNIDVSSKGFQKHQPVIELLCEILAPKLNESHLVDRRWEMKPWERKEFLGAIKGLKIETCHIPGMKRKYVVMDLGKSASTHYFPLCDEGASNSRQISVEQYFLEKYRIQLKYPHLPCLIVGQKKNFLPMEVCNMVPCPKRKLSDKQTAEMIKKTARPAFEREKKISDWACQLESKSHDYLKNEFGMSINRSMVDVRGRVLPAPKVEVGDHNTIDPRDGAWDMRGYKFFKGSDVQIWAMVCFENPQRCDDKVTSEFAKVMNSVCHKEGMTMNRKPCAVQYARDNANIEKLLTDLVLKHQDLQLVLVVLPSQRNKDIYKEVKRVGDTILGIPTQCVQIKPFMGAKPQVCSNIAMKMNAKLGGINHIVDPSMMPDLFQDVIVFGADVTHPSPGERDIPSIAAVVASMDSHASRYAARVRAQVHVKDKAAQEIILDMAAMVKELLVEFYQQTKTKPKRIIFYRDGVSEGQFDQVLFGEVKAVQQACLNIQKDGQYQPPITFIVVQKRHHARLFCVERKDQTGRHGNVPPGTTVDHGITHPYEFDFYLCSHAGIQGTSRPTHYHVLYDDNNFNADGLQKLTYHLCHTYARCTRSVSMPSPAYYAHLVAFRGRHHLNGLVAKHSNSRMSEEEIMKEFCAAINVNKKVKGGMYFA